MDRVIEDLQWFYKTLDIGGKTAEFYEAQKNIILQTLVILKKQQAEKEAYNQALEDALNVVEWDGYTLDIKERIERLKK